MSPLDFLDEDQPTQHTATARKQTRQGAGHQGAGQSVFLFKIFGIVFGAVLLANLTSTFITVEIAKMQMRSVIQETDKKMQKAFRELDKPPQKTFQEAIQDLNKTTRK